MPIESPFPQRSIDALDYQDIAQPIGAMAKNYGDGDRIPPHSHKRHQVLFAASGVMRLGTERAAWVVPPDRAAYIPAGTVHTVEMHGPVEIRTLYIDDRATSVRFSTVSVLPVTALLRELILQLSAEPIDYAPGSRGARLADLIAFELRRAEALPLSVPLPRDPRLQRVCAGVIAAPDDRRSLEAWAENAGASPRTLARLFQREFGLTFNRWRQQARFQAALADLARGDDVGRVAARHGYRSPSAFSAAFAKVMGAPPTRFPAQ